MTFGLLKIVRPGATAQAGVVGARGFSGAPGAPGAPGAVGPAAFYPAVAWATNTQYLSGPPAHIVTIGGSSYVCAAPHVSGVFATDLATGYWKPWASKGDTGTPGSTWYSGSGLPAATVGTNGDYFFRTDDSDVLLKTAGAWAVITNINGLAGNTIRTGTGAPPAATGANGDFYIDNTSGAPVLYGPKAAGAWPSSGTSLVGPSGPGSGTVNPSGTTTQGDVAVFGPNGTVIKDGGTLGDAAFKNTGTAAGTLAAGNDPRITGAAQKSANLSDLASPPSALANLGGITLAQAVGAAYGDPLNFF